MVGKTRILILEDNVADARLMSLVFDEFGIEVNDEFLRALGYVREEVIGRTPWELGIGAEHDVFGEVRARLAAHGGARAIGSAEDGVPREHEPRVPHALARLEVRDSGIGIDAAYLPNLFEPFSQESSGRTRAFEGLGIGLALVRRYLDANGATIGVESEKGRGTTFTIRFGEDA